MHGMTTLAQRGFALTLCGHGAVCQAFETATHTEGRLAIGSRLQVCLLLGLKHLARV